MPGADMGVCVGIWALPLLAVTFSSPLSAAAPIVPVQIRFEAPAACPDEAVFWREITARSDRIRAATDDATASQFEVSIAEAARSYEGTLTVRRPNAVPTQRRLSDVTCSELVSALALIAALTVDPEAGTRREAAAVEVAVDDAPVTPERRGTPRAASPSAPAAAPREASAWSVAFGSQLEAAGWLAPEPMLGSRWFWELGRHDGPAFRTSLARSSHSDERAQLIWATARLEACPLALGSNVRLRPCGGLDAGLLLGSGASSAGVSGLSFWKRWLAADLLARVYVPVVEALELQVDAGLTLPLVRDRFVVDGAESGAVHEIPVLGGFLGLGLGLRFGL